MTHKPTVVFVMLTTTFALACGGGAKTPEAGTGQTQAPAKPATSSGQVTVAAGDYGVPECDQYMKKYLACVDSKVPDAARPFLKQSLDQTRDAWKQAAATPEGRAGLAAGCKQAEAAAKQSMAMYGCQW